MSGRKPDMRRWRERNLREKMRREQQPQGEKRQEEAGAPAAGPKHQRASEEDKAFFAFKQESDRD